MIPPDPRTLLVRPDLAEAAVEGLVRAPTYRPTEAMQGVVPATDILDDDGNRISQLLFGEVFDVLIHQGDHVWGRCRPDGVVGRVATSALREGIVWPTHQVSTPGGVLPLNAMVDPGRDPVGDVALTPIGRFADDLVGVAESLLGAPHAPGGRTAEGLDCSGLVQACLRACGRAAPRHADDQAELGQAVELADLRRGDLIVWPYTGGDAPWTGHSAIALGPDTIIHASGKEGRVLRQALELADTNQRAEGFDAPIFRRI